MTIQRYTGFSTLPGVNEIVTIDFKLHTEDFGESVADFTYFTPTAEKVRSGKSDGSPVYDFPNGKDDGSPVPVSRSKGPDIIDVYKEQQNLMNEVRDGYTAAQEQAEINALQQRLNDRLSQSSVQNNLPVEK